VKVPGTFTATGETAPCSPYRNSAKITFGPFRMHFRAVKSDQPDRKHYPEKHYLTMNVYGRKHLLQRDTKWERNACGK